jgi:cell division septum initiation protein DivIVA
MDYSPQDISTQTFAIVKKGYDPAAVRSYLGGVSKSLEASQQQATAMEARARAAVAKLQELTQAGTEAAPAGATPDESDTISRTLLLAQRTADGLIGEARGEADTMVSAARAEATNIVNDAQRQAEAAVEEGRAEGRKSYESERSKAESEVQALLARRDFLLADVEQLETFVGTHRQRLSELADTLRDTADNGFGELRRPLLSAAADLPVGTRGGDSPAEGASDDDDDLDDDPVTNDLPTQPISSLASLVDADPEPASTDTEPTPIGNPSLLDFDGPDER